jgi:hypothetical protein
VSLKATTVVGLQDGFALGRQTVDVTADELLQLTLTLEEKVAADPGEFVRPAFGHFEGKQLHMFFVD